jgi:hypothetical protein
MVGADGDTIFTPSEESESRRSGVSIPSGLAERGVNWRGRIVVLVDVGLIDGGTYLVSKVSVRRRCWQPVDRDIMLQEIIKHHPVQRCDGGGRGEVEIGARRIAWSCNDKRVRVRG